MSLWTEVRTRVAALLSRRRMEQETEEEMRFHVERETEERIRAGADPATARREALRAFGGTERYREEVREARGTALIEQIVADLRYATRALFNQPGFTAAVVLVLGLAIGTAAAVFTVTDAVLFSELPYPEPGRLVRIYQENSPTNRWGLSVVDVEAIRDQQRSFASFGAVGFGPGALAGVQQPENIFIGRATSGFFAALGVQPAVGRLIEPKDESPGAPPVVVLTDIIARRALGGAAGALGRQVTLDGVGHTVIGVLPGGVNDLVAIRAGAWTPLPLPTPTRRGPFGIRGFARLKPGVTHDQAVADLVSISKRVFPIWSTGYRDSTARYGAMPLRESIVGGANQQLGLFAAAVLLVLLVAIANVATLTLVRTSAREHEIGVRVALGAGRRRLAALVASEGLVLTLLAAAVGLAGAWLGVKLLMLAVPTLPRASEVALGTRGIAMVVVLALASGLIVHLSPIAAALARRAAGSLKGSARQGGAAREANRLRGVLVSFEFALALPLLLAAGLLLNSFVRLQQVDPGFNPQGVIAARVTLPAARYPNDTVIWAFWQRALARAEQLPVLSDVGLMGDLPPDTQGNVNNFNLVEKPVPDGTSEHLAPWSSASSGYFRAMGVKLLEGRLFTAADTGTAPTTPTVVVVSHAWATRYFPGESAVGKQLVSGGCYQCARTTVVGVVGDVKYAGMAGDGVGVYNPIEQQPNARTLNLVARTQGDVSAAFAALRREFNALDPELPIAEIILSDRIAASLANPRRWTGILGAFAGAALLLAALGIFGLMSYAVRQRQREIGVRLALGARPSDVTSMIVTRGMRYALVGTVIGVGLALLEGRWLRSLLYGVTTTDPLTIIASAMLLLAAALAATWLPGLRAARIKPNEALSSE